MVETCEVPVAGRGSGLGLILVSLLVVARCRLGAAVVAVAAAAGRVVMDQLGSHCHRLSCARAVLSTGWLVPCSIRRQLEFQRVVGSRGER